MDNWRKEKYNGWKNYYTWNVALYLNNDEGYYGMIKEWRRQVKLGNAKKTYLSFINMSGLRHKKTPDGVAFLGEGVSRTEILNNVLLEE